MKWRYFLLCGLLVMAAAVAGLAAYPYLPDRVPSHWNLRGQVNSYAPKWTVPVVFPGIMAATMLLFAALPWLSPEKFTVDSFEPTYLYLMVLIVAILAYVQGVKIWAAVSNQVHTVPMILGGAGALFALMGNVLGKVRRNFYVGIRTPWTLADERVWNATQRFGAKTFTVGGLLVMLLAFWTHAAWLPIVVMLLAALSPVLYSLVVYKKLERQGEI